MRQKKNMRRHRRRTLLKIILSSVLILVVLLVSMPLIRYLTEMGNLGRLKNIEMPDWVEVDLVGINGIGRSGTKLDGMKNIVIHYVGNKGTSAKKNRDYFNNADTTVSSHFVVGLEGEVIQCVPLEEKSSASNHRNHDTISIEVCHPDDSGKFTEASYKALVQLTAWLCNAVGLKADAVIRHYDVTGKLCPLYYSEHEGEWKEFLNEVAKTLKSL